jgi:hypothetical protein
MDELPEGGWQDYTKGDNIITLFKIGKDEFICYDFSTGEQLTNINEIRTKLSLPQTGGKKSKIPDKREEIFIHGSL